MLRSGKALGQSAGSGSITNLSLTLSKNKQCLESQLLLGHWVGGPLVLAVGVDGLGVAGFGEAEGSLGAGSRQPPLCPFPGSCSGVPGSSCPHVRAQAAALLGRATGVASTEMSVLCSCVLVFVLLTVSC